MSESRLRSVRSFVRREGRITRGQKRALDELLPRYRVSFDETTIDPVAVFGRTAAVTVEIGFGNGASLAQMAIAEPEMNFVGAEVYRPGVGKLLLTVEEAGIENIRVYPDDATDLLKRGFDAESVDRLLIYFPDPWPKKKHLKRRLLQPDFVELAISRLRPGGLLHVATDIESYAEFALEALEEPAGLRNTAGAGSFSPRPEWRPKTKYEARGERLGHNVYDLIYERC